MYGVYIETLNVKTLYVSDNTTSTIWTKTGDQGQSWKTVALELSSLSSNYKVTHSRRPNYECDEKKCFNPHLKIFHLYRDGQLIMNSGENLRDPTSKKQTFSHYSLFRSEFGLTQ